MEIWTLAFRTSVTWAEVKQGREQGQLLDLSGQHAALYPQVAGDVNVLPGDGVEPHCETVHGCQKQDPGEHRNIKDPLEDVVSKRTRFKRTSTLSHGAVCGPVVFYQRLPCLFCP